MTLAAAGRSQPTRMYGVAGAIIPPVLRQRFAELKGEGKHSDPDNWDTAFRTQTGQSINMAANGIAKLLRMMAEEDN